MAELTHVKGLDQLQKFLDQLPVKMERNVMRGALRAAAKDVLLPAAKAGVNSISGELAASLRVSVRARRGEVRAAVKTDIFYARFVEYGTRQHWISVAMSERPSRMTRRGVRLFAIGTLNEIAYRGGSLQIGSNFVGKSVVHPGIPANSKAFMRPALDNNAGAATVAAAEYIKGRLATKHGLDTSGVSIELEEGEP